MDGAACFRDIGPEGLFPSGEAWKCGEQRGVNVDDAMRKLVEERRLDHAHVACEHNEVGLEAGEVRCECGFRLLSQLRLEGAFWDAVCGDVVLSCDLEDARVGVVGTNSNDGGG